MSFTQESVQTKDIASNRAAVAARTLENHLTGTVLAAALTSALLVGMALADNNFNASFDMASARVWNSVSALVCGSHLDAVSLVGPSCGRAAP